MPHRVGLETVTRFIYQPTISNTDRISRASFRLICSACFSPKISLITMSTTVMQADMLMNSYELIITMLTAMMASCGSLFLMISSTLMVGGMQTSFLKRSRMAVPLSAATLSYLWSFWLSIGSLVMERDYSTYLSSRLVSCSFSHSYVFLTNLTTSTMRTTMSRNEMSTSSAMELEQNRLLS